MSSNALTGSANAPGIFVSDRVHQAAAGIYPFAEAGTITGADGVETVWRLDVEVGQSA